MEKRYITLGSESIESEHLCCAISDKKHQAGVVCKKAWLRERIEEGHVFRKLDAKGKVFIEYAPLETAWVPITGKEYLYIYCLWVAGSYKEQGHGKELLEYCLADAKARNKSGVCVLTSAKKKPFLADKKFFQKFGFKTVDSTGEYELMALSFDGSKPQFMPGAKQLSIESETLHIYYSPQCPYTHNCIDEIQNYCDKNNIPVAFMKIAAMEQAKAMPCVFNNWAVFYKGNFVTTHLLNEGYLKKILI